MDNKISFGIANGIRTHASLKTGTTSAMHYGQKKLQTVFKQMEVSIPDKTKLIKQNTQECVYFLYQSETAVLGINLFSEYNK